MPNKNSSAGHQPLRMCVICREKKYKKDLLRFLLISGNCTYDLTGSLPGRGFYVCDDNTCLEKMEGWIKKRKKLSSRKRST